MNLTAQVLVGNAIETIKHIPDQSIQTVVTSPPYWGLRDYGNNDQLGLERNPDDFIENLCKVFDEVSRVLKDDGTIWVNLGDSYAGSGNSSPGNFGKHAPSGSARHLEHNHSNIVPEGLKPKDLVGIPWRFAFAMQKRGWYLRQDIIWSKPNPMPESVADRCTKSHEYIFLMSKNPKYFYDYEAIKEPVAESTVGRLNQDIENQIGTTRANGGAKTNGNLKAVGNLESGRNKRSVWSVTTSRYKDAHFATYPPELITPCILAGSSEGDIVLDPFSGSGTTGEVALIHNRNYIGLELNPDYAKLSEKRLLDAVGMFASVSVR
jgi:DNA modification methylase